ncbi:zf-PARP-domain-containing protein [Cadophora sp. DSE1049]|nr:zf-PARP-domain-containing protein [Cadophora sp. DSE1049]
MSYRVETALSSRSGCSSTECKDAKIKIEKDELRLGTWVEFPTGGGWVYRHWGCVTGKVLESLRKSIEDPEEPGTYRWDMLDGYDSGDKNSLDKRPDLQDTVRRCITQGFIDPEDWNGDPEMNVLGAVGMRTKESVRKAREEKKARNQEIEDLKAQVAALQAEKAAGGDSAHDAKVAAAQADLDEHLNASTPAAGKKRAKNEAEAEEGTPVKKKRVTKKKAKAEDDEDEGEDVKPAKPTAKSRTKKVKKEEENEDDAEETKPAPAKKSRAKNAVKKEAEADKEDAQETKPAPAKKPKAKKVKKEEDTEMSGTGDDHTGVKNEEDAADSSKLAPKKRGPAKKRNLKAEADEDADSAVKNEEDAAEDSKPAPKKRAPAKKKAVKTEANEDIDSAVKNEDGEDSLKPAPPKRAPRGKKAVKDELMEDGAGVEAKPKPAAKKGRKKAVKQESVEEEGVNDGPAAESSNPGVTEGSSVLSDAPELPEGMKDELVESVSLAPEAEDASAEAVDEVKDL